MKSSLKEGWESKITGQSTIYPLGLKDRKLVDKTFDDIHEKGRFQ